MKNLYVKARVLVALAVAAMLIATVCGCAEWQDAFEHSKEDPENKMSMQIEKKDDGTEIVHVTLPKQKLSDNAANLPFDNRFTQTEFSAKLSSKRDLTPRAVIEYRKRAEGTYVYSNNPEMLAKPDVGQALLRNEGLTGEVFFTYEHSNHTGAPIFLGYQLLNEGDTPVTVRVENIGNQVRGEWLGQREWTDFFGVKFDLPADYWNEDGQTVNPIYVGGDYVDYAPQGYVPEEFTVPAGGYVWVLGGTSGDRAYGALSGKTADQAIMTGKCANGAVRFIVSGGSVTGTFWCYTEPSQCDPAKPQQGYIIDRDGKHYAAQYKGIDTETNGLAEAEVSWIFNDMTRSGKLPVTYQVRRDPNYASVTTPYTPFNLQETTVRGNTWLTSLNPNNNPTAVGTDMINFSCVTTDGKEVRIDTESTDGAGKTANIGNWMMENQTNFTFINAGTRDRKLRIYTRNTGVLAVMIRNEGGELLEQKLIMQPYSFDSLDQVFAGVDKSLLVEKNGRWWFRVADGRPYCDVWDERSLVYELTVPAGDYCRISVDDLILANSCGGVLRWVEID